MTRWEGLATEHEEYDSSHAQANDLLKSLRSRLHQCHVTTGDRLTLEDAQQQLTEVLQEKEASVTCVHDATTRGEHLLATTSSEGCEVVRLQVRLLRESLETLSDEIVETQRRHDVTLHQLTSFEDNCDRFQTWLTETSVQLKQSAEERVTLQEKKLQTQSQRAKHQDILSHQQVLDSLCERFHIIATSDARAERQLAELSDMYGELCARSGALMLNFEQGVERHQRYHDSLEHCTQSIANIHAKLDACSPSCDLHNLLARKQVLERDVTTALRECEQQVRATVDLCEEALQGASAAGGELLKRDLNNLNVDFKALSAQVREADEALAKALQQWQRFEAACDVVETWLAEAEEELRSVEAKPTLEEKSAQRDRVRALHSDLQQRRTDVDKLTDSAHALHDVSSIRSVLKSCAHVTARYEALLRSVKESGDRCHRCVLDHENYRETYNDYTSWMAETKRNIDDVMSAPHNSCDSIAQLQQQLSDVSSRMREGFEKLNSTVERADVLYPDTASGGRERLRQQMRLAKQVWDSLLADLDKHQSHLESAHAQWTAFEEALTGAQRWLDVTERQVRNGDALKESLSEKQVQLQSNEVLQREVNLHSLKIDALAQRADVLIQSSNDDDVTRAVGDCRQRYDSLVSEVSANVKVCRDRVERHVTHQELIHKLDEWIADKLDCIKTCSTPFCDRHDLQSKLKTTNVSAPKHQHVSSIFKC